MLYPDSSFTKFMLKCHGSSAQYILTHFLVWVEIKLLRMKLGDCQLLAREGELTYKAVENSSDWQLISLIETGKTMLPERCQLLRYPESSYLQLPIAHPLPWKVSDNDGIFCQWGHQPQEYHKAHRFPAVCKEFEWSIIAAQAHFLTNKVSNWAYTVFTFSPSPH